MRVLLKPGSIVKFTRRSGEDTPIVVTVTNDVVIEPALPEIPVLLEPSLDGTRGLLIDDDRVTWSIRNGSVFKDDTDTHFNATDLMMFKRQVHAFNPSHPLGALWTVWTGKEFLVTAYDPTRPVVTPPPVVQPPLVITPAPTVGLPPSTNFTARGSIDAGSNKLRLG